MQHALDISTESEGNVNIINLGGALDTENVDVFKKTIDPLCTMPGGKILLDCSNLVYVNSGCFGLFNKYHGRCEDSGCELAFCRVSKKILDIMKLLGLTYTLKIYASREEALKELEKKIE